MSRVKCKRCDYEPSEYDTLNGYCLECASNITKEWGAQQNGLEAKPEVPKQSCEISKEFADALIADIRQASRIAKMPNEELIACLNEIVWGKTPLMTLQSNLVDEAITRLEKFSKAKEG